MTESYTYLDDTETIVEYNGWVVLKGMLQEYHTPTKRTQVGAFGITREGTWIQHNHYKGSVIWATWDPKVIDNKCMACMETLSDVDLAKLMCFAKAIK